MEYELGEVIAERVLAAKTKEGKSCEVSVLLGMPKPMPEAPYGDYYCPYLIRGVGPEKIGWAGGVDAIQAMQLAMVAIGAELENHQRQLGLEIAWVDGSLGFPTRV